MRDRFVKTSNALAFLSGLAAVENRGAEEACLMVVDGEPGIGKTEIIRWWAIQQDAVYVRAKTKYTPNWMLRDLLTELQVKPAFSQEKMFNQAVAALSERAAAAAKAGQTFGVVFDEADHFADREDLLEQARDLSDLLEIPVILVGMDQIRDRIKRHPQIARRIGKYVGFKKATPEDARKLVDELCEVPVKDDLVAFLHTASGGYVAETKEGIRAIEDFGRVNPGAVGVGEMAGRLLLKDRATGKDIFVPR